MDDHPLIRVHSKEIDFSQQITQVLIYDSSLRAVNAFFAEILIHQNNQPQTSVFEFIAPDSNCMIVLIAVSEYDLSSVEADIVE
ncbi:hypothetical protein COB64_04415 [Candidatus Wolfebacteria bacterium]|nr:MAG: hypothetical protein COB64_04415 [Candidatus Wolfebacteria bacterium]